MSGETRMVHLDDDDWWDPDYSQLAWKGRRMACGMRQLAEGHTWVHNWRAASLHATCPTCLPHCERLGTPLSELSGQPGTDGYAEFVRIAQSWGYD